MTEKDRKRVIGKIEADKPGRNPGCHNERDPRLKLKSLEKEAGIDRKYTSGILEYKELSDRVIRKIDPDQKNEEGQE
jgi:hypothetical protein